MADRNSSFAVIGLGSFGATVATELAELGGFVLGIDTDEGRVSEVADKIAEAKILDAREEAALREAGLDRFGAVVVAIGENIESSVLATMNARLVGCHTIWAKARDRTHYRILVKLGADRVLMPEKDFGMQVAQMLHTPAVHDFVALGNGFLTVSIDVPQSMDGRSIGTLDLGAGPDLRVLGLMRGSQFHDGAAADFTLRANDRLLVLGTRANLRRFGETI